jgi:hypothetical protein
VSRSRELQTAASIAAPESAARQSPEHKRFYSLIRQIEKSRQDLSDWRDQIHQFSQVYVKTLRPLQESVAAAVTEWTIALDAALGKGGWTRTEQALLGDLILEEASALLAARPDIEAVKQLFDKYSQVTFDSEKKQELAVLKVFAQAFGNVDLGDTSTIHSEAELEERIFERMAADQEARQTQRSEHERRRPKTAAQLRREQEAERVTQSVREIFRKLASALHPDREPDPELHARKTSLMQKVNQAYEANDLLTLLEVQLQIEQVSPNQLHNAGSERLKHYNKVLSQQLGGLQAEIYMLREEFQREYRLRAPTSSPRRLGALARKQAQLLRAELAEQQQELLMLSDKAATKRWLKQLQQEQRAADRHDRFF